MSPVYRGQHMLKRMNKRELYLWLCALSCPAEAITMKAEERKADEKHLYERKNMLRYEINMLRCIFFGCVKRLVRKDAIYLTT
jgi:NADH-quinone oxidoreductase subunit I